MTKYYSVIDLSENLSETPEGYLICKNASIARAGELLYSPHEVDIENGGAPIVMTRTIDDLCSLETISSFEGKPVTIGHPDGGSQFVSPLNWHEFTVGTIQNVRQGEGENKNLLMADLLITDAEAISTVKSGKLRELSCGYDAKFIEIEKGKAQQTNIIGNHVALVESGRCGSECSIFDSAPVLILEEKIKMSFKDRLMKTFGKALDEAMPEDKQKDEDLKQYDLSDILDRVKKLENSETAKTAEGDPDSANDKSADPSEGDDEKDRFSKIEDMLSKMMPLLSKISETLMPKDGGENDDDYPDDDVIINDRETVSRAEILSPGIGNIKEIKKKSLDSAYKTEEGKKVIDSILCGKKFADADKDILFVASSEMLKNLRGYESSVGVIDSNTKNVGNVNYTPEMINEKNAEFYHKNRS